MTFAVTLSPPSAQPTTVQFATADGTATAGQDYVAVSGTLSFAAGETQKTVAVSVLGDLVIETNETFFVNLSGATGSEVEIEDAQGQGTIVTDDFPPPLAETGGATGVGRLTATLNGWINPNGTWTTAFFEWQAQPFGSGTPNTTAPQYLYGWTSMIQVSSMVTGLQCGTPYYFRIAGTSAGGTSRGSEASFQTADCDPIPPETFLIGVPNPVIEVGSAGLGPATSPAAQGATLAEQRQPSASGAARHADRILVKPRSSTDRAAMAGAHRRLGGARLKRFERLGGLEVVRVTGGSLEDALARYRASPLVEYAEPDYRVSLSLEDPPRTTATANDPSFVDGSLWGLHNTGQSGGLADADIDGPEAWDVRTDASAVLVAVIDTGIRTTHQDLASNLWTNPGEVPGNGLDDDGNGYVDDVHGINAITGSGNPADDHGHGTHVAGTIGARGNDGVGVTGVAWQARILACKFLDATGYGYTSDAVECVDYARSKGARVLNNSWGGGDYSQALADAITALGSSGGIFVAAAGNYSSDNDAFPMYPASYTHDNVVAVAATTRTDSLAYFSNFGATSVDLGAPGFDILSTYHTSDTAYTSKNGTSMAAPHVTGALALMWAHAPGDTPFNLIQRLLVNTDPLTALEGRCLSGGRLNLARALTGTVGAGATFTWTGADNLTPESSLVYASRLAPIDAGYSVFSNRTTRRYGGLGPGAYTFYVKARDEDGNEDPTPAEWTFSVVAPALSVDDASVGEGDGGSSTLDFTISLVPPSGKTISVNFTTADGTATGPADYASASGTLTFAPGETSKTVSVSVHGDLLNEGSETFQVHLSNASGASIADADGIATILDDDPVPSLTIGHASKAEGNAGSSPASFWVTLSAPSGRAVSVDYATSNVTASAGADYVAASGVLTIPAGQSGAAISISVVGDALDEPNEAFVLTLSSPQAATLANSVAQGVILDDDGRPALCLPIAMLPFTITTSDKYCLTANLSTDQVSGAAITIAADEVTLDLQGFVLDGTDAGLGTAAHGIHALDRHDIVVRGGGVRGFLRGVFLEDGPDAPGSYGHTVRRVFASENTESGIRVDGPGSVVRDSLVVATGGSTLSGADADAYGIVVGGAGSRVLANDVIETRAQGTGEGVGVLLVSSSNSIVEKNRVSNASLGGATASGIVLRGGSALLAVENRLSQLDYGVVYEGATSGRYRGNLTSGVGVAFSGGPTAENAGNNH